MIQLPWHNLYFTVKCPLAFLGTSNVFYLMALSLPCFRGLSIVRCHQTRSVRGSIPRKQIRDHKSLIEFWIGVPGEQGNKHFKVA